jgi:hypothetical protein
MFGHETIYDAFDLWYLIPVELAIPVAFTGQLDSLFHSKATCQYREVECGIATACEFLVDNAVAVIPVALAFVFEIEDDMTKDKATFIPLAQICGVSESHFTGFTDSDPGLIIADSYVNGSLLLEPAGD